MENESMVKVLVDAKIENLVDLYLARQKTIAESSVRRIVVVDALIDTGATTLSMPGRLIRELGLERLRTRQALTTAGVATFQIYGAARLTIQGRDCTVDVTEVPEGCPVLIGQVPLELLDFIVDPGRQQLIGNPAHGGEQMLEMY